MYLTAPERVVHFLFTLDVPYERYKYIRIRII
jgi:hypothetical protein